ncbi:MAG: FAD-binding oxidoreductase, partial [Pseudonocardia sp.]|nr:FAD-binding oxidoreductase [Pseudonocardia sp.]
MADTAETTDTTDTTAPPIVAALRAALPADRVVTDPELVVGYAHDEAEWAPHGTPSAVVRPRDTSEVAAVVSAAAELRVPLVPRGAGTGLSGGANAVDGCVLLSLEAMRSIVR